MTVLPWTVLATMVLLALAIVCFPRGRSEDEEYFEVDTDGIARVLAAYLGTNRPEDWTLGKDPVHEGLRVMGFLEGAPDSNAKRYLILWTQGWIDQGAFPDCPRDPQIAQQRAYEIAAFCRTLDG